MRLKVFCVVGLGMLSMTACGTKKSASERNFSEALNVYLAKKGQLCLGLSSEWPVDVDLRERGSNSEQPATMAALEKIGLVHSHETEISYTPLLSDRPIEREVIRYELTEEGRRFYREQEHPVPGSTRDAHGDLCYGQEVVDRIVKWEGPIEFGTYKQVSVFYTYKVEQVASWASDPEVQRAFPGALLAINGAGQRILSNTLILTNGGWEAE